MLTIKSSQELQRLIQRKKKHGKTVGFVPTMGYLHQGHASLLRRCRNENDISVLSIFVNPMQFAPGEDFERYPRDEKKDKILAKKEFVDIIFHPSVKEMYPTNFLTSVEVKDLSLAMCGESRPGHFKGVCTVVAKLLNIVLPDKLYLGQKDAQQAVILKKMVQDLNFPVQVTVLPTVREEDGLAMSSRNSYLHPKERAEAPILYHALRQAKQQILGGEKNARNILKFIQNMISEQSSGRIDYIQCVDAGTFRPLDILKGEILIALAVKFGSIRLIDNILVKIK